MRFNADFSKRAVAHAAGAVWQRSPATGVERRMLDRIGGEKARATTVVRYLPGSRFPPHVRDRGEEFFVLGGVFSDEHGDFPAGTYVRNPPTSSHAPGSRDGCTIFVKLRQFNPDDRTHVTIDTNQAGRVYVESRPGVAITPLYQDAREQVRLEYWDAGNNVNLDTRGGAELFVLDGGFASEGEKFAPYSWLRLPDGGTAVLQAADSGARLLVKTGHLTGARTRQPRSS